LYAESVGRLIEAFKSFPGIGRKTAERMAFHLLVSEEALARELVESVREMKRAVHPCVRCFNITDREPCEICSNDERDGSLLCVVEQPRDVIAIERSGLFRGRYHVLLGCLAPMDGVTEKDLTIGPLIERLGPEQIEEVLLATSPSLEGDATALLISRRLGKKGVKVSRIARGLPTGSDLERVGKAILADAIETRRPFRDEGQRR